MHPDDPIAHFKSSDDPPCDMRTEMIFENGQRARFASLTILNSAKETYVLYWIDLDGWEWFIAVLAPGESSQLPHPPVLPNNPALGYALCLRDIETGRAAKGIRVTDKSPQIVIEP